MNKTVPISTRPGMRLSALARDIRDQFLGSNRTPESSGADLRVMLYSHDTMGMGHMRRNLLIASAIRSQFPRTSVLSIAGAKEASIFANQAGLDCLTLPSFQKRADGTYGSRSLGIAAEEILDFRGKSIRTAVESFRPDLLIVDKLPAGAGGELLPALEWISAHSNCRCVLGLRDILDAPEKVAEDWRKSHSMDVIRKHFESIWIYGDRQVFDAILEYNIPKDIADRTCYTGYLNTQSRLASRQGTSDDSAEPFVLCSLGGGQDGESLPISFVEAIRQTGRCAKLLLGPYMPAENRARVLIACRNVPSLEVIEFAAEGDLLARNASHIVSMGGYNTLAAILSWQKKALIVPRVTPREEQLIRANRLAQLGYVDTIHPNDLSPESIVQWLGESFASLNPTRPLDMNGLQRICDSIHAEFPSAAFSSTGAPVDA